MITPSLPASSGKKPRKHIARRSTHAQSQTLMIIDKLAELGGLEDDGTAHRLVIEEYIADNCWDLNKRVSREKTGKKIGITRPSGDRVQSIIAALDIDEDLFELIRPKRWQDTSVHFRRQMILYGAKGDTALYRQFTTWIGDELIKQARMSGTPLSDILLSRIRDHLDRLMGAGNWGIWFNIESRNTENPYDLHAHGVFYVADPAFLRTGNVRKTKLYQALRTASGWTSKDDKSNWTALGEKSLNRGWMEYCLKCRRDRRFETSKKPPPIDIGHKTWAGSRLLTQRAKRFYERMRVLTYALADESILEWDQKDWEIVSNNADEEWEPDGPNLIFASGWN